LSIVLEEGTQVFYKKFL